MAGIVAGIMSIFLGLAVGIKILIKPYQPSSWLFNKKGIAISLGSIILGTMLLSSTI